MTKSKGTYGNKDNFAPKQAEFSFLEMLKNSVEGVFNRLQKSFPKVANILYVQYLSLKEERNFKRNGYSDLYLNKKFVLFFPRRT